MVKKSKKKTYEWVLFVLVGLLLVTTVVQAVQINELRESGTGITVNPEEKRTQPSYTQPTAAPTMVGGC